MTDSGSTPDAMPDALFVAVSEAAQSNGGGWFPELDGARIQLSTVAVQRRPRCSLYRVAIGGGHEQRRVVVKVRHGDPSRRRIDRYEERRPVLTPERTLSETETARREYDGLRLIERTFRDADRSRFGVVRPLALLPDHAAVIMDHVGEPTLRDELDRRTALPRGRGLCPAAHNAGAWLRAFHGAGAALTLPQRGAEPEALARGCRERAEFLLSTGEDAAVVSRLAAAAARAGDLPASLPLAAGHGDFTAVNIFVSAAGRVTVFDPMALWQVPVYEDIARMTVGVRDPGSVGVSGMLTPSRRSFLDGWEALFLAGYFGAEPVPHGAVWAYQALLLLDRWGDLRSKQVRGSRVRQLRRQLRVAAGGHHYRREASRLTRLLESSVG